MLYAHGHMFPKPWPRRRDTLGRHTPLLEPREPHRGVHPSEWFPVKPQPAAQGHHFPTRIPRQVCNLWAPPLCFIIQITTIILGRLSKNFPPLQPFPSPPGSFQDFQTNLIYPIAKTDYYSIIVPGIIYPELFMLLHHFEIVPSNDLMG